MSTINIDLVDMKPSNIGVNGKPKVSRLPERPRIDATELAVIETVPTVNAKKVIKRREPYTRTIRPDEIVMKRSEWHEYIAWKYRDSSA
jgi:hypothetical protein